MATIIGRTLEQAEMQRVYDSGNAEFLVVYGRRRVGKTYLVREYFKNKLTFHHTGLSPLEFENDPLSIDLMQRTAFASSLRQAGLEVETVPATWIDAFDLLKNFLAKKMKATRKSRIVVFIDELPWMDTPDSGFMTAFEHFWNGWGAGQDKLMLIACGSATTWMTDNLINNNGGLYGRVTHEIKLAPFNLSECEAFFRYRKVSISRYDQLQSYMIFGGIPYYLGFISPGVSLAKSVDAAFFEPNAKLRQEFDRLFNSVFRKSLKQNTKIDVENYKKVVMFLSKRREGYTRKEISDATGIPYGGTISDILKSLEGSDFIRTYLFYKGSRREVRYKLTDFFVLFYLRFVSETKSFSASFWQENQFSPAIIAWRGITFEEVCWNHQRQLKDSLGIREVKTLIEPWRSQESKPGAQIDLVIERSDRVVHLCEMKFTDKPWRMQAQDEQDMRTKISDFIEETRCQYSIIPVLISASGIKNNDYSSIFQHTLTMDFLFKA